MKSNSSFTVIIICAFMFMSTQIFAGNGHEHNSVAQAPLDAGVSLLIAAGIGYGVKKVRDKRKKDRITDNRDNII